MKKKKITSLLLILLVVTCYVFFSLGRIDQSQLDHDKGNDWTAGNVGQVFIASRDGLLVGVKVKTQAKSYGEGKPAQRPLRINLVTVGRDDIPTQEILTSGRTRSTNYANEEFHWRTIFFDPPYQQLRGEKLALVIGSTEDVKPHAWHEIAFTESDTYPAGILWFSGKIGRGGFREFNGDMAFQTIVALPNPLRNWINRLFHR